MCRLDRGVFIFPRSSFCKVTWLPSRTDRSLVFLYRFSHLISRTGLCAWTKALLFFHHSFIFHATTLHLPYLLQHVPRIWNLFHIIELGNPIGWCHDSYPNINGKCRKPHPTSRPFDTKRGLHAGCTKCSPTLTPTFSLSFLSSPFTTTTTSITPISICIGPGPINNYILIISNQGTKDCQPPPLFWKKRWHGIFYQWMLSIYLVLLRPGATILSH